MKFYFLILITIFINNITFIYCDCNYITIGANTDKCAVIDKEDKTKSCCYVKIKKNDYTITYCTEIKNTKESIRAYRDNFKNEHDLSKITVKCHSFLLKYNLIYFTFSIFILF
jgi:hypothetical protein